MKKTIQSQLPSPVSSVPKRAWWSQLRQFCAMEGDATFIWTRWLMLRSVGLLFIISFWGIIAESSALLGPEGITAVGETLKVVLRQSSNPLMALLNAPGLFWISADGGMIMFVQWLGMAASIAVVLNLWPRISLAVCWLAFLSFTSSSPFFAMTKPDPLLLELALLCIPFSPGGFRPGLAAAASVRPLMVFALRFMLLRLMLEAGLAKFVFGEDMWRDFTAMDVMYETAPFPTALGYFLHHLPHWFHGMEIGVTFLAEVVAPVFMIFGGRRWRWFAFLIWSFFQLGIQFTNNFAWLNVGAIALAFILIDDQMWVSMARCFRLNRLSMHMGHGITGILPSRPPAWALHGLRVALSVQFVMSLCFYAVAPARISPEKVPEIVAGPMKAVAHFHAANSYALFGNLPLVRYEVEFQGSNDGGETWRSYEFRYKIGRPDRMSPFVAPWYPRFDAILQHVRVSNTMPQLYHATAVRLLQRKPAVMALFASDPFPDRPPAAIRMVSYRYEFTDLATWKLSGHYWRKTFIGDWQPLIYLNEQGEALTDQ